MMPMCGGFIVFCQGHVLLVKTPKGVWGFPKGKRKLELNEPLIVCAFRELEKESGVKQSQIHCIDIENTYFDELTGKGVASVRLFLATVDDMIKVTPTDPEELAEVSWVPVEKARDLLTVKNRAQLLQNASDKLNHYMSFDVHEADNQVFNNRFDLVLVH